MSQPDVATNTDAQGVELPGMASPSAEGTAVAVTAGEQAGVAESTKAGPKSAAYYQVPVQTILEETAPMAARRLQEFVAGRQGHKTLVNDMRLACEYIINQVVGKPRQRVETVGVQLTYSDLAKAAAALDKGKQRPVLADVMELSNRVTAGSEGKARATTEETEDGR